MAGDASVAAPVTRRCGGGITSVELIPRAWELIPRAWELLPRTWRGVTRRREPPQSLGGSVLGLIAGGNRLRAQPALGVDSAGNRLRAQGRVMDSGWEAGAASAQIPGRRVSPALGRFRRPVGS